LSFHPVYKKIFISEKNYLVWIRWFTSGAQRFSKAARVAFSADMYLIIKTVCLLEVMPEMLSF
jgi:hypothetical protein